MSDLRTMWIGMRAQDAAVLFERLTEDARQAIGRDGAMEIELLAEPNEVNDEVRLVFNNDDMERPEMAGRTIVEWE
jgi:hypothetical protein